MCGGPLAPPLLSRPLFPTASPFLRVRRLSSLRARHQRHLLQLAALVDGPPNTKTQNTFVACRVVAHAEVGARFSATGVNHALHRERNAGQTLRGILRGCAEQNALGVAAAGGHRYAAITDIYLCANGRGGALLPCAECWRHLAEVAAMRRAEKDCAEKDCAALAQPLRLFVQARGEAIGKEGAEIVRPPADIEVTIAIVD